VSWCPSPFSLLRSLCRGLGRRVDPQQLGQRRQPASRVDATAPPTPQRRPSPAIAELLQQNAVIGRSVTRCHA